MKNIGFRLKRWLIISPFTLAFISLPSTGLAIDVKDAPKLSSASQELTQETRLPWVALAGGGALVLAIAATHYISRRQRRKLVKPSGYTSQVSSNRGYSQRYNYVHWDSRHIKVDVDIDVHNCDANNSDRIDWGDLLDSCENRSDESTSSNFDDGSSDAGDSYGSPESSDSSSPWSSDESDREYNYELSDCSNYESDSSWNSDTSSCSNDDSDSSWNSDGSDNSWSSDNSNYDSDSSWSSHSSDSSWSSDSSSYDSSSSSDYGGGSSDGGGADGSW